MSQDDLIASQQAILRASQEKLDELLKNQSAILANQEKILAKG